MRAGSWKMLLRQKTSALVWLTLALSTIGASASAEDFVGLARDANQVWFISTNVLKQADGDIRTHVYQVFRDGQIMGGKTFYYADWIIDFDCAGGNWYPVQVSFVGDDFSIIASSDFAGAKPEKVGEGNVWGPRYACDPSAAEANRRLSGADWKAVASSIYPGKTRP